MSGFELIDVADGVVGPDHQRRRRALPPRRRRRGRRVRRSGTRARSAIVAIDEEHVWLTRQPREAVGDAASLEVPAGKLDVPGEPPLETAKRELVEEIGKQAAHWEEICVFWTSPGFSDERVWLYLATGLSDAPGGAAARGGRADRDRAVAARASSTRRSSQCEDSKSLIALLWLRASRSRGAARHATCRRRPRRQEPRSAARIARMAPPRHLAPERSASSR